MKYDDAEYYFLNFTTDLPNEAGATHTGLYVAWLIHNDLVSVDTFDESTLDEVKARTTTGRDVFVDCCDCKLMDDDLNPLGNAFTEWYYETQYFEDYRSVFGISENDTADEFCQVEDTWNNFDKLAPFIDQRYSEWNQRPNSLDS